VRVKKNKKLSANITPLKPQALAINRPKLNDALTAWQPSLRSGDLTIKRNKITTEGRTRDLYMTSGLVAGLVKSHQDNIVGSRYTLQLQPNYKALGIDASEAMRWANGIEQDFLAWAENPDCYIDVQRRRTFTDFLREAVATYVLQGEVFVVRQTKPSPYGFTCFTTVEPERVCNPSNLQDDAKLLNGNKVRQGVEYSGAGEAVAYHILQSHQSEQSNKVWERFQRVSNNGFVQVIHLYTAKYADQTRGFSDLTPVVKALKMLDEQQHLELQMSQVQTAYAMYLKTAGGTAAAKDLLGFGDVTDPLEQQLEAAATALDTRHTAYDGAISIDGVRVPVLLPGDEINTVSPHNQPNNHEQLKRGLLNEVAKAAGISYEQLTGDFTGTSYSSARASMSMSWEATLANRSLIVNKLANTIFRLWFDEQVLRDLIQTPVEYYPANDYQSIRTYDALTRANWIGSGRTVIDDYKQAKANTEKVNNLQGSLQDVLKENGTDLESVINAQIAQREALLAAGLPLPTYLMPQEPISITTPLAPDPLLVDN
jgi:lambda family phage portal protein